MGTLPSLFRTKPKTACDALQGSPRFPQQKALFDTMSAMCAEGVDASELPNGFGPFSFAPSIAIHCKTVFGSIAYLGRPRASDGTKVTYERIGSDVPPNPIDAYDVAHRDGHKLATVDISPYHQRIFERAPKRLLLGQLILRLSGDLRRSG